MDLIWSYSNRRDLADTLVSAVRQLRQAQADTSEPARSVRSAPLSTRQWRIGDQLTEYLGLEQGHRTLVIAVDTGLAGRAPNWVFWRPFADCPLPIHIQ